jgi:hypothetical protein
MSLTPPTILTNVMKELYEIDRLLVVLLEDVSPFHEKLILAQRARIRQLMES